VLMLTSVFKFKNESHHGVQSEVKNFQISGRLDRPINIFVQTDD